MWGSVIEDSESTLQEQEHALRWFIFLNDSVDDLDHRPCGQHAVEVVAKMRERVDDRHLRDRVEILALVEDEVDMCKRLEPATKTALRLAHTLGDRSKLAVVGTQDDDDAVGLAKRISAQHDPLVVPYRQRVPFLNR